MKLFNKKRYYLVSYSHEKGFGSACFKTINRHLNIKKAGKDILKGGRVKGIIIITINKINESQYEEFNV